MPVVLSTSGNLASGPIPVPGLAAGSAYSVLFSLDKPPASPVQVSLEQDSERITGKTLHAGDADFYSQFRAPHGGAAVLRISVSGAQTGRYQALILKLDGAAGRKLEPCHRWQDANAMTLGSTVFASTDEIPYIPLAGSDPKTALLEDRSGLDWYQFEFDGAHPKLVYFQIELTERDNIPVDVSVYRLSGGQPVAYYEGEDPVALPHEVQAFPGNKFTTRVLKEKGTYLVAVRANHPEYKLRTRVYDPPPYTDAHTAVRTALDFILGAGDSWHANTPRRGGVLDRISNVHQETSLCVACHPTHFPQRAQLYAARNGYPVVQRQQLQFLAERFYNNPRPFYGFEKEGVTWARMISAPANVLSRMSVLMDLYEREITGERREAFHRGIAGYLNLYYAGLEKLPPDETNGNTPLVSAHEVAWYSWRVTGDAKIPDLVARGEVKNVADLCYQTLALVDVDRKKYGAQIEANAARLLALQRPDGQWAMRFDAKEPEAEFQTGHALWALQAAGIPKSNPQVAKAIAYLLKRQQEFGGWMDPLQSYENFRTPFRETQMAILGLSSYFPLSGRTKGWNAQQGASVLEQLDATWDQGSNDLFGPAASNDVLVRQQALEALGRLAQPASAAVIAAHLGDESKLVQRTAAWALRQVYSRHPDVPSDLLLRALQAPDERTRWGATRVFATHFSALAQRPELARALTGLIEDEAIAVRMQALKGLWQFWYWTPDAEVRGQIEDALLAAAGREQHPWIAQNVREAIYNIADENLRYFYNNWVPLLARPEDRRRAVEGRLAVERRLAGKFARVLESGNDIQKKTLLTALTQFPLRGAAVNRIGNDIEQVVFFGESSERFAHALAPLLDSPDSIMRKLAQDAAQLVRPARFPAVNEIAGAGGESTRAVQARLPKPEKKEAAAVQRIHIAKKLDENFFRGYVQPILEKRGADGNACVHCHATHTLFNGTYATALNVVDREQPENSLILRKPTTSSENEGKPGAFAHGGGVRWTKDSPEYQTILEWIKGAAE